MRVARLFLAVLFVTSVAACEQAKPAPAAAPAAPAPQPYGSLAEVMRAIPFPNSNIIFDTQTSDPGAPKAVGDPKSKGGASGASGTYSTVYGGWQAVENSAVAISEMANLIMIPGRKCENGLPVPLDQENFKMFAKGLADAGQAAYKAAKSKNHDAMVEVSGTVADACAMCHEKYRDVPDGKMRCVPVP